MLPVTGRLNKSAKKKILMEVQVLSSAPNFLFYIFQIVINHFLAYVVHILAIRVAESDNASNYYR